MNQAGEYSSMYMLFLHFNCSRRVTCPCLRFPKLFFDLCTFVHTFLIPTTYLYVGGGKQPKIISTQVPVGILVLGGGGVHVGNHHVESLDRSSTELHVALCGFPISRQVFVEEIHQVCFPCIHKSQDKDRRSSAISSRLRIPVGVRGNLAALFPNA